MTAKELLIAARELLSDRAKWTKGVGARDSKGLPTDVDDPDAVSFCSSGAMRYLIHKQPAFDPLLREECLLLLSHAAHKVRPELVQHSDGKIWDTDYLGINDHPAGTHADVLAMFDAAIAEAK